ncbi:hypothetical protein CMV30_07400 [Nibricoccus aquaticus]|uniref:Uncharacterized protein n=1 Tax=Nibricoccus aquaticus TaxID=2576891 RepID=A0A290QHG5_9BACT|nr:hypothetical protein CMV30_07400 [Nibricoccus aquaticus]
MNRLAAYKVSLRRDIGRRRVQCVADTARVMRPLVWAERVRAFFRKLGPLAAIATVPALALVMRVAFPARSCSARWCVGGLSSLTCSVF